MSKLIVEKNKVIVDGHASDLETCNTLTNLCDELAKSDKFKTIAYGSGYGEFESVVDNENKKFPKVPAVCKFVGVDGASFGSHSFATGEEVYITDKGVFDSSGSGWTYNGKGKFLGIGTTSTECTYPVGSSFLVGDSLEYTLYVFEKVLKFIHFRSDESWAKGLSLEGSYNSSTYVTSADCKLVVDKDTGYAFVVMRGGTSTAYENIYFNPSTLPSGITALPVQTYGGSTSGSAQRYFVQVLKGITGPIKVTVNLDQINSTYDYVRATLIVAYV